MKIQKAKMQQKETVSSDSTHSLHDEIRLVARTALLCSQHQSQLNVLLHEEAHRCCEFLGLNRQVAAATGSNIAESAKFKINSTPTMYESRSISPSRKRTPVKIEYTKPEKRLEDVVSEPDSEECRERKKVSMRTFQTPPLPKKPPAALLLSEQNTPVTPQPMQTIPTGLESKGTLTEEHPTGAQLPSHPWPTPLENHIHFHCHCGSRCSVQMETETGTVKHSNRTSPNKILNNENAEKPQSMAPNGPSSEKNNPSSFNRTEPKPKDRETETPKPERKVESRNGCVSPPRNTERIEDAPRHEAPLVSPPRPTHVLGNQHLDFDLAVPNGKKSNHFVTHQQILPEKLATGPSFVFKAPLPQPFAPVVDARHQRHGISQPDVHSVINSEVIPLAPVLGTIFHRSTSEPPKQERADLFSEEKQNYFNQVTFKEVDDAVADPEAKPKLVVIHRAKTAEIPPPKVVELFPPLVQSTPLHKSAAEDEGPPGVELTGDRNQGRVTPPPLPLTSPPPNPQPQLPLSTTEIAPDTTGTTTTLEPSSMSHSNIEASPVPRQDKVPTPSDYPRKNTNHQERGPNRNNVSPVELPPTLIASAQLPEKSSEKTKEEEREIQTVLKKEKEETNPTPTNFLEESSKNKQPNKKLRSATTSPVLTEMKSIGIEAFIELSSSGSKTVGTQKTEETAKKSNMSSRTTNTPPLTIKKKEPVVSEAAQTPPPNLRDDATQLAVSCITKEVRGLFQELIATLQQQQRQQPPPPEPQQQKRKDTPPSPKPEQKVSAPPTPNLGHTVLPVPPPHLEPPALEQHQPNKPRPLFPGDSGAPIHHLLRPMDPSMFKKDSGAHHHHHHPHHDSLHAVKQSFSSKGDNTYFHLAACRGVISGSSRLGKKLVDRPTLSSFQQSSLRYQAQAAQLLSPHCAECAQVATGNYSTEKSRESAAVAVTEAAHGLYPGEHFDDL